MRTLKTQTILWKCPWANHTYLPNSPEKWAHTNIWHKQTGSNPKTDSDFKTWGDILPFDCAKWDYVACSTLRTCRHGSPDGSHHPASLQLVCNNLHRYQPRMNSHVLDLCQQHTAGNSSNCFLVKCGAGMGKEKKTKNEGEVKVKKKISVTHMWSHTTGYIQYIRSS